MVGVRFTLGALDGVRLTLGALVGFGRGVLGALVRRVAGTVPTKPRAAVARGLGNAARLCGRAAAAVDAAVALGAGGTVAVVGVTVGVAVWVGAAVSVSVLVSASVSVSVAVGVAVGVAVTVTVTVACGLVVSAADSPPPSPFASPAIARTPTVPQASLRAVLRLTPSSLSPYRCRHLLTSTERPPPGKTSGNRLRYSNFRTFDPVRVGPTVCCGRLFVGLTSSQRSLR